MKIYRDTNDWRVGYYRGPRHHFVCVIPTVVIRWGRRVWDINSLYPGTAIKLAMNAEWGQQRRPFIRAIYPPYDPAIHPQKRTRYQAVCVEHGWESEPRTRRESADRSRHVHNVELHGAEA